MSDISSQTTLTSNQPGSTHTKRIVIIGGGFAGVNFAQRIAKDKSYEVTLVDKNNYNYFPPLLYQVSTSFLEPSSISYPFRKLFRKDNIRFRMGQPLRVDTAAQTVYFVDGELNYDYLVFASGARTNFFGNENIEKNAIPMKTIDDGLRMRNALLKNLERASISTDPEERKKLLTIVIAGGGPTGVEVSGMMAEMKNYIFKKDYPELVNAGGGIYIVDGSPNLLGAMSEKTHKEAYKVLTSRGVHVKLNSRVSDFSDDKVTLASGEVIETKSLIWAAGIIANTFEGIPATSLGPGKRMITNEYNLVQGLQNVYAIGDACILTTDAAYPNGHPQIAQVAIQQGRTLATNFMAMAKDKPLKPFIYFDKGDMAIIGRNKAVVDLFKHKVHFGGIIALFMWLFIHLISLVNYRNKLQTLYSWAVSYISRDQSLRMIFRSGS